MQILHKLTTPLNKHGLTWTHLRITLLQVSTPQHGPESMRLDYQLHNDTTGVTWPVSESVLADEIQPLVDRSFRLRAIFDHLPLVLASMLEPQLVEPEPVLNPQVIP
jgi:hypothetical protein